MSGGPYNPAYYEANKARILAANKKWRDKHKEERKPSEKARLRAHREKVKDRDNAARRERYAADADFREAEQTRLKADNKTKYLAKGRERRGIVDAHKAPRVLAAQGGVCAICERTCPGPHRKNWAADHDHETGLLRGLLCTKCNMGLGAFADSISMLAKAARYLANPPAKTVICECAPRMLYSRGPHVLCKHCSPEEPQCPQV